MGSRASRKGKLIIAYLNESLQGLAIARHGTSIDEQPVVEKFVIAKKGKIQFINMSAPDISARG